MAANKTLTDLEKKLVYKAMHRNIADMESDGLYFDETIKEIVQEQIKVLTKPEEKAL
jgi:hypothetical protein